MNTETLHWDISNNDFCLWDWNIETGTIGLSQNCLDILGVDQGQYRSSSSWFNSLIHPQDLAMVLFRLENSLAGIDDQIEFRFRLKNVTGEFVWFESKGMVVFQKENGFPGHVLWASEKVADNLFN